MRLFAGKSGFAFGSVSVFLSCLNLKYPLSAYIIEIDFGIRQQPQLGQVMAAHFQCEVHAFDPSPVSVDWYEALPADHPLKMLPNYHFHPYGVSGHDGTTTLFEYNWGQVSTIRYPAIMRDCGKIGDPAVKCKIIPMDVQGRHELPVKTMKSIRRELGHEDRSVSAVKIDIEGSEYGFLYSMLDDYVCPDFVEQLTLEWHHYPIDVRYGEGSSPDINQLATMLHACGLKSFWFHDPTGWKAGDKLFHDLGLNDMRYNLQSFHRSK